MKNSRILQQQYQKGILQILMQGFAWNQKDLDEENAALMSPIAQSRIQERKM